MLNLKVVDDETYEKDESDIYYWAKLFKSDDWRELKMLAEKNEYIKETVYTLREMTAEEKIREQCEALERYYNDKMAVESIRNQARLEAHKEGFSKGFGEGYGEGRKEGYGEGRKEGYGEGRKEGYGEGREEGYDEAEINAIKNIMSNLSYTKEEAMDVLGISGAQREALSKRLENEL